MKEIMKILMTMMMMMKNKRDGEEDYKNNSCGSDQQNYDFKEWKNSIKKTWIN